MNDEQAKKLREPFKPEQIGKLPKPTKKDNPKGRCGECGGWHGLPAVHLDYVGHAATTDRLLQVDPEWTWEPMAHGPNGEPLFTNGGLWIWLTVCGVRRPGFGDGQSAKEVIGDAIRNAAMRFGVALDLWAKEDLHGSEGEPSAGQAGTVAAASKQPSPSSDPPPNPKLAAPDSPFKPPHSTQESIDKLLRLTEKLGAMEATLEAISDRRFEGTLSQEWVDRCIATAEKNLKAREAA